MRRLHRIIKPRRAFRRGLRGWLPLALILGAVLLYSFFSSRLEPLILSIGRSNVENAVTAAINKATNLDALSDVMDAGSLTALEKDADGRVTAIITNMAAINNLQSVVADRVIAQVSAIDSRDISIPLGSVVGGSLLSGRGPRLPVRILTVSSVSTDFENVFTDAGINQTRHEIILNITVTVRVLLPGGSCTTDVHADVSVTDTVIVGEVPDSFTFFGEVTDAGDAVDKYMSIN